MDLIQLLMRCLRQHKPHWDHVCSNCLSGQYPAQWADGYITPLHKSNDSSDPTNYRGISITSAIGKVFNTVLNNRLDSFLIERNIIDSCQIGFTKNARTVDHMFILKTLIDKYCSKAGGRLYACFVAGVDLNWRPVARGD